MATPQDDEVSELICRNCQHAIIGKDKGDKEMAAMRYKSCRAAATPEERARFVRGDTECVYPERAKEKLNG